MARRLPPPPTSPPKQRWRIGDPLPSDDDTEDQDCQTRTYRDIGRELRRISAELQPQIAQLDQANSTLQRIRRFLLKLLGVNY